MNVYTSEAVDFFGLVLTSGIIALTALGIASVIAFTLAYFLFRERAVVAAPAVDMRPQAEPAVKAAPERADRPQVAVAG
jgi:hypothetical protein